MRREEEETDFRLFPSLNQVLWAFQSSTNVLFPHNLLE
jgi:hypothetical protein